MVLAPSMQRLTLSILLTAACAANAATAAVPRGTHDILRAASLEPIAESVDSEPASQASQVRNANRRRSRRESVCESEDWRKLSLKTIREMPIAGALGQLQDLTKFEASGIALRGDSQYFVVLDNSRTLAELDERLQFKSNRSRLVPDADEVSANGSPNGLEDSQFEGITHVPETDTLLVIKEESRHGDHYHPVLQELKLSEDGSSYTMVESCRVDFEVSHANKGFEGIQYHEDQDGGRWLLGLCEGNFCSGGKHGRAKGNGRIILSKHWANASGCGWEPHKVIEVPSTAYFGDYSDLAFRGDRLAITSQEDSEVWIGDFDKDKMEFTSEGAHYHFPRNDDCEHIYCNVEGVEWIDDDRLMLASDRAKADQPFICTVRDQSVHIMVLPHGHRKNGRAQSKEAMEAAAEL